ncbi:MAG: holo-[acyl-carrier-protein] synthase [Chitinivibrionales bacterium]|nr:holo-[acyl-carrier-protein] synthase [Chitinivibrionales bacterium]
MLQHKEDMKLTMKRYRNYRPCPRIKAVFPQMIKGLGVDIADSNRIAGMLEKYGDHFITKAFTTEEIRYCSTRADPPLHYAGRWAAKEAFYKALPESCQKLSTWKSVEIRAEDFRAPFIRICNDKLNETMKNSEIDRVHLSISHDRNLCIATVILE